MDEVVINGVGFMRLNHHDGRFVRGEGLYAFARQDADGGHTLFCLEMARDISRVADVSHDAWGHAVARGMNELLVHLAGTQQTPGEVGAEATFPPIRFDLFVSPDMADEPDAQAPPGSLRTKKGDAADGRAA